jgi:hypothetical protein
MTTSGGKQGSATSLDMRERQCCSYPESWLRSAYQIKTRSHWTKNADTLQFWHFHFSERGFAPTFAVRIRISFLMVSNGARIAVTRIQPSISTALTMTPFLQRKVTVTLIV